MCLAADRIRSNPEMPKDCSMGEIFSEKFSKKGEDKLTMDHLLTEMGIEPHVDTVQNLLTLPDDGARYIVPELMRDPITLGLRLSPIYPNIISSTESVSQTTVKMPYINMMDAAPFYVNEGETIKTGGLSYGSKELRVRKMGRGLKMTREFLQYTTLNVLAMFLRDFGVKLGYALDGLAIDILLNGEQANGSESAAVIGVATPGTLVYRDLLRIWVRLARMGKAANTMVAGETMSIDIMDLDEYKLRQTGTTEKKLNVKTPLPNEASLFIHGSIPDDQVVILDPATTMIKYDAQPVLVEGEKIVSNQTEATYVTLTTGFGIAFRDSRLILDTSLDFSTNGFPAYMNVDLLTASELE